MPVSLFPLSLASQLSKSWRVRLETEWPGLHVTTDGDDGTEKLNDLPRVTQEVCGRAGGMKPSVLNSTLPLTHSPCFSGDTTEIRRNVEGVQCRWSQVYTSCEFGSGGRKVKRCVHETGLGPYVPTSSAGLQAPIAGALK
ncbi:unnamed protein product [Eretmochelys imbricata]